MSMMPGNLRGHLTIDCVSRVCGRFDVLFQAMSEASAIPIRRVDRMRSFSFHIFGVILPKWTDGTFENYSSCEW